MRYLHIPKITVFYICMMPLLLLRSQIAQRYKCIYALLLPFPLAINETIYYPKNQMFYLESIAELIKVYSIIEHQSAETYS